jgi:acyl carrier protein
MDPFNLSLPWMIYWDGWAMLDEKVIAIITRVQKLEPGRVTPDSTFEELGIDSLDGVNLLFAFEEEFNLSIPEHVAREMKSVRQVVEGLRSIQVKRGESA